MVVINMGNKSVFKALSSETRIKILKILSKEQLHITGLAKKNRDFCSSDVSAC
jgi:DNA-binding transcriptional ArsR family regulator